jgi:hypothetical protein
MLELIPPGCPDMSGLPRCLLRDGEIGTWERERFLSLASDPAGQLMALVARSPEPRRWGPIRCLASAGRSAWSSAWIRPRGWSPATGRTRCPSPAWMDTTLKEALISFDQHCEGGANSLRGCIHYTAP